MLGTLIALLLVRVSAFVRMLLTAGLVLVWSMPVVVAVQVWYWMTNFQNGVLNYILKLVGDFFQHDWYATTFSQLGMVTTLIVWGRDPVRRRDVYAGLAQVPHELVEAAEIDGAALARLPRRHLPDPEADLPDPDEPLDHLGLRRLHAAVPADRQASIHASNYLMGVYVYREGYFKSDLRARRGDLDPDARDRRAMSVFYVRKMVRMGDVR